MMTSELKERITEGLKKWLSESPENRTLNGLADEHSIPKLYLSLIKNGTYEVKNTGTIIKDEYFYHVAHAIGLMHRSHTGAHWETLNFKAVVKTCRQAQGKRLRVLLQGDTGFGKTYALDHYQIHNDKVIYVKVTRSMTERNLLEAIIKKLGVRDFPKGNREKINHIRHTLAGTPGYLLIIDEAEYLRTPLYHTIKEICDFTEGKCGFIMSGYDLIKKIQRLADKGREGFPQLRRRFFPNRMLLPSRIENSEKASICVDSGITDKSAINIICQYCDDFDMLSQVVAELVALQKKENRKVKGEEVIDLFKDSFDL
jgi:hypothetical protein